MPAYERSVLPRCLRPMVSHLDCRAALLRAAIIKKRLNEIYVRHTGQSLKKIEDALERDMFLTADGAKEFGIIDKVMEKRSEDIGELIAAAKSS